MSTGTQLDAKMPYSAARRDVPDRKRRVLATIIDLTRFLLPVLGVLILWEFAVQNGLFGDARVPAPSAIYARLGALYAEGILQQHIGASMQRLLLGYLLAVTVGIIIGVLLSTQKLLQDMFLPLLDMLISIPTIAWVPVLLITLGLGDATIVAAIFLGGVFAVAYNTMRGIAMVSPSQINAGRIMGYRGIRLFLLVLLPGAFISILVGMRLAIGYSWRALVGGEMLAAMITWGVGKMIYQARFFNDVEAMFLGLLVIGFVGLLLDRYILRIVEIATVERWGMLKKG